MMLIIQIIKNKISVFFFSLMDGIKEIVSY